MSSLDASVVAELVNQAPFRILPAGKQLTLALGGLYFASTTPTSKPSLVWETENAYPRYYIPVESLHDNIRPLLAEPGSTQTAAELPIELTIVDKYNGDGGAPKAVVERLIVGQKTMTWVRFLDGPLKGFIRFERSEIDDWFENGSLFVSIKNPYKRIDTAAVSRHIVVKVDGEIVAETNVAVSLTETNLPETFYFPATAIKDWGAVEKSSLRTACPYKGEAWYLSIHVAGKKHENLIWYYPYPTHESAAVAGLVSFYKKENVEISVDGVKV